MNSARWSLSRVGVSVMNSRRAQKAPKPASTTVAVWCRMKVAARIEQSTHQACTRMRKVSRMAVFRPLSLRARRARMMTVAAASKTSTLTTRPKVLGSKSDMDGFSKAPSAAAPRSAPDSGRGPSTRPIPTTWEGRM